MGADYVIDYTKKDFTRTGQQYDLILAANGYHPLSAYKSALAPQGTYIMSGGSMAQMLQTILLGPWMSKFGGKKMCFLSAMANQEDLSEIKELLESDKIVPVIDKRYALNEAAEALYYIGKGHARGKVVIIVETN